MAIKQTILKNKIGIIGSGFSGLSAAIAMASDKNEVHLFEKNSTIGGRSRQLNSDGFVFDMGPSWYWMPDVFESFIQKQGYQVSDLFKLVKLDPAFRIIFEDEFIDIPNKDHELEELFESIEKGSALRLRQFLQEAKQKYEISMADFIYKPCYSPIEFMKPSIASSLFKLQLLSSFRKHVKKFFKHPKLISIMEFPVLFLGAMPNKTPALYSLMNYAGLKLGTWYPMGGFGSIISSFAEMAKQRNVTIHTNEPVNGFAIVNNKIAKVIANGNTMEVNGVIATADYQHVDNHLLGDNYRMYSNLYWESRTLAPSSLIFYIGVNKKINNLVHHNLFFDSDYESHAHLIYENPMWPKNPLFYVCCPSKTDPDVAPQGHENVFVLIPIAPDLEDNDTIRKKYFDMIINRLEKHTCTNIRQHIVFNRSYCVSDFKRDYNAYKGNAYGLASTLKQTAFLRPGIRNRKVKNLFYAGHLTIPGPGVPPALISGQIAAKELSKYLNM